jgi:hypothetical protein
MRSRLHSRDSHPRPTGRYSRFQPPYIRSEVIRPNHAFWPQIWLLILLLMSSHESTAGDSNVTSDEGATLSATADGAVIPPDFPDDQHVINGCYISTMAYIAKLKTSFPAERAEPLTIFPRHGGVRRKPHTLALFTWRGQWWIRDEFFGLKSVRLPVKPAITPERVAVRVAGMCEKDSLWLLAQGKVQPLGAAAELSLEQKLAAVIFAASVLPYDTELYWVRCKTSRTPMLFFRPHRGAIAVYDPQHGTALAESNTADGRKIVPLVAQKLGYVVDAVDAFHPAEVADRTVIAASAPPSAAGAGHARAQ